jgi:hypothetical protein
MGMKKLPDGSVMLPRRNRTMEQYLNSRYIRLPNQLKWIPRIESARKLEELRVLFKSGICCIVGKGPSLDHLTSGHFTDVQTPIFAINQAIHKVESLMMANPIFAIQQDVSLMDTCKPKFGGLLISAQAKNWYADFERLYIYQPEALGLSKSALTVLCAIEIAKSFDVNHFELLCFDACVTGKMAYAKCVGSEPGDGTRFLKHRPIIDKHTVDCKVDWIIPQHPALEVSDIPMQ